MTAKMMAERMAEYIYRKHGVCLKAEVLADALKELHARPVAWMVERDTEYESREFFLSEEEANKNAALGVVHTRISPLYKKII